MGLVHMSVCGTLVLAMAASAAQEPADGFALPGGRNIMDEEHFGIINGKITAGIDYKSVGSVRGLWSPPYVSSDFLLTVRIAGQAVPTVEYSWEPYRVERSGSLDGLAVGNTTALIYGHRAGVVRIVLRNDSDEVKELPLAVQVSGTLDRTATWEFSRAQSATATTASATGALLILEQGPQAIAAQGRLPGLVWDAAAGAGTAVISLAPKQERSFDIVFALGERDEALAAAASLAANPDAAFEAARREYEARRQDVFGRLPAFEASDPSLHALYYRSLVHLLTNRWDIPEFVLQPYYSTGSIKGGCVCEYLWNFGEVWEILPLLDPDAAREHIKQFLKVDITEHFAFMPVTGEAFGPWYPVNQEKIIGLVYYYVKLTGDVAFLDEQVAGKSVLEWVLANAYCRDNPDQPVALVDYGPSNSHLELRRGYPYNHVMPDLNGRRYANYLRAADLAEAAGRPDPRLRERAAALKTLLKERLWDPQAKWFHFLNEAGEKDMRLTVQMFKLFDSGVLDEEEEAGILSHLNETEFLSEQGLHSMAKTDIAYDQVDIDNGGGGNCTCFPPQVAERLYRAGYTAQADDVLRRILWWGERMPYWGDSLVANSVDYRRDTPLQCTLDGAAVAQCMIFGFVGVDVAFNGDIAFTPHCPSFVESMSLRNLRLRGTVFEVTFGRAESCVRTGEQSVSVKSGESVRWTAATQRLEAGR